MSSTKRKNGTCSNRISKNRLIDVIGYEIENITGEILSLLEEQQADAMEKEKWPARLQPTDPEDVGPGGILALAEMLNHRELLDNMKKELQEGNNLFGMPLDVVK